MPQNNLTTAAVPKLIRDLAIPSSIGFFFNTMYNVVDTLVAGRLSTEALAALSYSFPLFFILIALGTGVGMGATALIATALGKGDQTQAERFTKQIISYGVMLSIVVTILGILLAPSLFRLLGATGANLEIATTYMTVIYCGSIFSILASIFNSILNAVGDTKSFRNALIASFFVNLLLTPILAFGLLGFPKLGISGIALATIITQVMSATYLGFRVGNTDLMNCKDLQQASHFLPDMNSFIEITTQGFPTALGMMTVSAGAFIITYFVSTFGEAAVAGYGVAMRIEQIILIPGIGINIAILTLVSQNNGARKFNRVREVIATGIRYSIYLNTVGAIVLLFFSKYVVQIFTTNSEVIAQATLYLLFAAFTGWAYGILFITDSTFRGLKRPSFPLFLGIMRQAILPAIVLWFAIKVIAADISGIWGSILLIVWLAALFAYWYMRKTVNTVCIDI